MSASMIFLKLELEGNKPIHGEATMEDYEKQIDVDSISWKIGTKLLPKDDDNVARVEARPKHIVLSKVYDAASGNLCTAADKRTPFTKATLSMVGQEFDQMGASDKKLLVLQMVLTDGHIEEVSINASEGNKAISLREKVTLSFAKSQLKYFPRKQEGAGRFGAMEFELEHPSAKS